jgi:hypothetical protein
MLCGYLAHRQEDCIGPWSGELQHSSGRCETDLNALVMSQPVFVTEQWQNCPSGASFCFFSFSSLTHRLTSNSLVTQEVDHVHFHVIPKPSAGDEEGLVVGWPAKKADMDELKAFHADILGKL